MKIIIYGSTYLTQVAVEFLLNFNSSFKLLGYVPSKNPTVSGKIPLDIIPNDKELNYDIKLSLGYDMRIKKFENAYNVHPGILPEYGGCDILYHTIKNNENYQGLTFHKMVHEFDAGPIISKIIYPVFSKDTIYDLYLRVSKIYPMFVLSSLKLLENNIFEIESCKSYKPILYKRGEINEKDRDIYNETYKKLKEFEEWNRNL